MKGHVTKVLIGLRQSLATATQTDVPRAKAALAKQVGKLVPTPAVRADRPIHQVTGNAIIPQGAGELSNAGGGQGRT